MRQAICPLCEKPVGPYRPGAEVYHWSCLKAKCDEHFNCDKKPGEKDSGRKGNKAGDAS